MCIIPEQWVNKKKKKVGAQALTSRLCFGQVRPRMTIGHEDCTVHNVYIGQFFFLSTASEVRRILKSDKCYTIQHIFVPARSFERKLENIQ